MKDNSLDTSINLVARQNNLSPINLSISFNKFLAEIGKTHVTRESYIKARLNICSERIVIAFSKLFKPLFNLKLFGVLMLIGISISIIFAILNGGINRNIEHFNHYQLFVLSSLCFIFTFFHEVGHATASYHMGCPASNIGVGLYIFLPVFYTDVSKIWTLSKQNRFLVNIGGIYFQLLINILLIAAYFLAGHNTVREWFIYLFASNSIVIISSLLPFFRNDGYWILSDTLGIPNLLKQSDIWISETLKGRVEKTNYAIIIFAITNQLFRLFIILNLIIAIYHIFLDCISSTSLLSTLGSIIIGIILLIALYLMCNAQIKKLINYAKRI